MTVTTTGAPEQYLANGVTTIFDFHSRVLLTTDIVVFVNNVQQLTGFTVALLGGGNSGARVTFSVAPANGLVVELSNEPPETQEIDYTENTAFPANVQEFGLDKLTLLLQGLRNILNRTIRRAIRVPIYESGVNELPAATTRAGKYLSFDASGQPIVSDLSIVFPGTGTIVSSMAALKALSVVGMVTGAQVLVLSYYGVGGSSSQFGGGVFRYNSASVVADDKGTIIQPNVGSGRWERMFDGVVYNTWFGTVGDLVTDDTAALQAWLDYLVASGRTGIGVKGNYLTGPLYGNGSAWVAGGKVVTPGVQLAGVRALMGQGRMGFGFRLQAKPGAYGPTDAVFTQLQNLNRRIEGIAVDCALVASKGIDVHWTGANTANGNTFRDWYVENCTAGGGPAIDISGAADGEISNIQYRGGTPLVGLRMHLAGGGIWCHDIYIYSGRVELSCQNVGLVNCFFANGIKVDQDSNNNINLHACQLSQDPSTGYTVYTDNVGTPFISSMTATSCLFLKGSSFVAHFAGRWLTGASIIGCEFLDDGYFDAANFTSTGSAQAVFDFQFCTIDGGGSLPATIPGVVNVGLWQCRNGASLLAPQRRFPTTVRIGDADIDPGVLDATATGLRVRGQSAGALTSDTYTGLLFNRQALEETEIIVRDGSTHDPLLRITSWDGTTATSQYVFNQSTGNGFYPSATNTWKLGRSGNVWTEVWATNATIQTSDADTKSSLTGLSAKELAVGAEMLDRILTFQWNDAIEQKGGKDKARLHVGLVAQEVKAAFDKHGVRAERYGVYCFDKWDADADREAGERHSLRIGEATLLMLASLNERLKKLEN